MTVQAPTTESIDEAQSRCGLYALLAAVSRYPSNTAVSHLLDIVSRCDLEGHGLQCLDLELQNSFRRLAQMLRVTEEPTKLSDDLRSRYAALFGHAVRGACPLYELEYGQGEILQQACDLADIAGFYSAFGLELAVAAMERVDHVSVQCEFMSVLCAKETHGLRQGLADLAETSLDAQRTFLRDHLSRWLPSFCTRVREADPDGVYGHAADLARAFLETEYRRFEIAPGPAFLKLRTADPQADAEIRCDGEPAGPTLVPLTVAGETVEGAHSGAV